MRREWDARAEQDPRRYVLWRRDRDWRGQAEDMVSHALAFTGVPDLTDARVLEIGCGVGRVTAVLAARAAQVVALDVSPRMIELARANLKGFPNVEFVVGDGENLSGIESSSIDLAYSGLTLQHLPSSHLVLGYIEEIGRVLRPGGTAVIQVNNEGPGKFMARRIAHRAMWLFNVAGRRHRLEHGPTWTGNRIALGRLRNGLRAAGLELRTVEGRGSIQCWITASLRLR